MSPNQKEPVKRSHDHDALRAADAAFRMWTVRIPCGIFATMLLAAIVHLWITSTGNMLMRLMITTSFPCVIEGARIALTGGSRYLRYLMAGLPFDFLDDGIHDRHSVQRGEENSPANRTNSETELR